MTQAISTDSSAAAEIPAADMQSLAIRDFSMAIALAAIWAFFAWGTDMKFVGAQNLSNLAVELSMIAVLALGQLLIILCGQIDLSIGSGVGLMGGIAAVLITEQHWPAPSAMLLTTAIALAAWLLMGGLIVTQNIAAFIVTLAGMLIFRGSQWWVIHSSTIPVSAGGQENLLSLLTTYQLPRLTGAILAGVVIACIAASIVATRARRREFGFPLEARSIAFSKFFILSQLVVLFTLVCNQFRGIPLAAVILAATAMIVGLLTGHTRFGRYLYAIGGNQEAATISGVPVRKVIIGAFGIMGLLVALGGFLQTAYTGSSTTTTGELLELDAIAACVIGGASLKGGRGTVLGVIFGSLIIASLINGMTLMALAPETKYIARGVVLALAVLLDVKLAKE
jgi:D-xylose transport system permease protein